MICNSVQTPYQKSTLRFMPLTLPGAALGRRGQTAVRDLETGTDYERTHTRSTAGAPRKRPAVLKSSSISGQWIP